MEETIQFDAVLMASDNKLWGCHFAVPAVALALVEGRDDRRVVCGLNGKIEYQCALLPYGNGAFVITVNKKHQQQLGLKPGSMVRVSLRRDDSAYGLPMPEELQELLAQDEEGDRMFHALTPGKIRTLLYIVGQPKGTEARLQRAIAVVEHVKSTGGKIDYKRLNEALKTRN